VSNIPQDLTTIAATLRTVAARGPLADKLSLVDGCLDALAVVGSDATLETFLRVVSARERTQVGADELIAAAAHLERLVDAAIVELTARAPVVGHRA
jgi:hypothetical protein